MVCLNYNWESKNKKYISSFSLVIKPVNFSTDFRALGHKWLTCWKVKWLHTRKIKKKKKLLFSWDQTIKLSWNFWKSWNWVKSINYWVAFYFKHHTHTQIYFNKKKIVCYEYTCSKFSKKKAYSVKLPLTYTPGSRDSCSSCSVTAYCPHSLLYNHP